MNKNARILKYYIGYMTIVTDEVKRFMQIWPQSLFATASTITLYFIIFGSMIGFRLANMTDISYSAFLAPGFILLGVITNAYGNVSFSLATHRFQRSIEELMVSPLPNPLILFAYMTSGVIRGIMVGAIISLISIYFTTLSLTNLGLSMICILLVACIFSLAGFINALYANRFDDVILVPIFVITPLVYLGGLFSPLANIPENWQIATVLNPVFYMVGTLRYGLTGYLDSAINVYQSISIMLLLLIALWCTSLRLLNKKVGLET